jgi:putative spermidine/putrescine transport system permease protein
MVDMSVAQGSRVANARSLKAQLRRAELRGHVRALGLIGPLFAFIICSFVLPIAYMMTNAVYDTDVRDNLPKTITALQSWNGEGVPDEPVFAALVEDLKISQAQRKTALIGKRLNYEISGVRSKVIGTARRAAKLTEGPYKDQIIKINKIWADPGTWATIKRSGSAMTGFYLLNALDLQVETDGSIERVESGRAIYLRVLGRTLYISTLVTLLTLLLAFPTAFVLANLPARYANILMIFVLLPFWTSLLVRTTAWFVLLQDNGLVNQIAQLATAAEEPYRMIFSRFGTVVAMTHIQLPFTLLPIYSVMKGISPSYLRAARSLGGGPIYSFVRVYLPLTLPGIGAGCLLTFIICLGYYITPALVGGPSDQMVSGFIEQAMNQDGNWGKACALGTILLSTTLILFYVYNKVVGIDKVKFG